MLSSVLPPRRGGGRPTLATTDLKAVDPRQLELLSPREEFLLVASARIERLEAEGEHEAVRVAAKARELGASWLPARPGGGAP